MKNKLTGLRSQGKTKTPREILRKGPLFEKMRDTCNRPNKIAQLTIITKNGKKKYASKKVKITHAFEIN